MISPATHADLSSACAIVVGAVTKNNRSKGYFLLEQGAKPFRRLTAACGSAPLRPSHRGEAAHFPPAIADLSNCRRVKRVGTIEFFAMQKILRNQSRLVAFVASCNGENVILSQP